MTCCACLCFDAAPCLCFNATTPCENVRTPGVGQNRQATHLDAYLRGTLDHAPAFQAGCWSCPRTQRLQHAGSASVWQLAGPPCALAHKSVRQPRIVLDAMSRVQTQEITSFLPACSQTCMCWVHSLPGLSGEHRLVRNNEEEMQASNRRPFGHRWKARHSGGVATPRPPSAGNQTSRGISEAGRRPPLRQRGPPSKEQHYSMFNTTLCLTAEASQQPRVAPQHTARTTSGRQHQLHVGVDCPLPPVRQSCARHRLPASLNMNAYIDQP